MKNIDVRPQLSKISEGTQAMIDRVSLSGYNSVIMLWNSMDTMVQLENSVPFIEYTKGLFSLFFFSFSLFWELVTAVFTIVLSLCTSDS